MDYNNIGMYKTQLHNIKSKYLFDKVILDVISKDWSKQSIRETTILLGFLSKLTQHKFFDENSIKIILSNFPKVNRYYNLTDMADFISHIINSKYCYQDDIRTIYEMFAKKSVLILETIAKCKKTPEDVLIRLLYSDQYSIVAAIGKNNGPAAFELLKLPEFSERVSSAQRIIRQYNNLL